MPFIPATDLTAELLTGGSQLSAPAVSPDGRWVAWASAEAGGLGGALWVAPGGGGTPARVADGPARLPCWSPDSAALFYVRGPELFRLPVTTGGQHGPAEPVLRWAGEIGGLLPLAGGRLVAVVAGDERTAGDEQRAAVGDDVLVWSERAERQHWTWHRLRLLDLTSGDLTVAAGLDGRHVTGVAQQPGGGPLVVLSQDCPEADPGFFTSRLHVADPAAETASDLGPAGRDARSPVWWRGPGGWHVAWLAAMLPADATAVLDLVIPAAGITPGQPADLTGAMGACPGELVQVAAGPPAALFAEGLDTALYRLEAAGPGFTRVAGWPGAATGLSVSGDARVIALLASTAYAAPDVWAGPPDSLTRFSDSRPELRGVAWGRQERLSGRAADGLGLDGVLVLPPGRGRGDGPFPLVTIVHGGPYGRWPDELMATWWSWGQWLAAAGFAVFHPNPRGSSGHGRAFADLVAGKVGQEEWTDILAGLDDLVAAGVADPGRLGIGGWSHGGFMAAWAVTQTARFRAAVMAAGVAYWGMQVAAGDYGRQEVIFGGSFGWEGPGPHPHDRLSPVSYAARVTTPVLILHGADDTNVPVGQATYFHRALSQFGSGHDLVIYPGEGHGYTGRAHQADVLERVRAWFTRWLAPTQSALTDPPCG